MLQTAYVALLVTAFGLVLFAFAFCVLALITGDR